MADPSRHLPLTPVVFEILLALGDDTRHGYALLQAVEERRVTGDRLHAGTLYRALARMVDDGFLEEVDGPPGDDERRRHYRRTELGRRVAAGEALRLQGQLSTARSQGLLADEAPAR